MRNILALEKICEIAMLVDRNTLSYESYTATGELYDAFDLKKSGDGKPNLFFEQKEKIIPARYHHNTIHYQEKLPEELKKKDHA